jgi:hypothetical protein
MDFVQHPLLNTVLNFYYSNLSSKLENNSRELLCETAMLFCKAALATGRAKSWPGSDHRIILLNVCYSRVFLPLKREFENISGLWMTYGNDFSMDDERLVFDIKRRLSLIFSTKIRDLSKDRGYYETLLRQTSNGWVATYTEWKNMWHIYFKEIPQTRNFTSTSLGRMFPKCWEICEASDVEGFSVISLHKCEAEECFPGFDLSLVVDCVPQGNNMFKTIRSLHSVIAQRYPGATFYVDRRTALAPIYEALGYTEVASRSFRLGGTQLFTNDVDFKAFIYTFPSVK